MNKKILLSTVLLSSIALADPTDDKTFQEVKKLQKQLYNNTIQTTRIQSETQKFQAESQLRTQKLQNELTDSQINSQKNLIKVQGEITLLQNLQQLEQYKHVLAIPQYAGVVGNFMVLNNHPAILNGTNLGVGKVNIKDGQAKIGNYSVVQAYITSGTGTTNNTGARTGIAGMPSGGMIPSGVASPMGIGGPVGSPSSPTAPLPPLPTLIDGNNPPIPPTATSSPPPGAPTLPPPPPAGAPTNMPKP